MYTTSQRTRTTTPQQHISGDFADYITSLATWEQNLLTNITFYRQPYEMMDMIYKLPTDSKLYIASDGSHKAGQMSFGWVFGSDTGEIFAENAGAGYGKPTSHRAEGWGILSGGLFIHYLQRYTGQQIPKGSDPNSPRVVITSDNQGLIKRLLQRRKYNVVYPNATLEPDWDLTEQIHTIFTQTPKLDHTYSWTKGHQDDSNGTLTTAAQYNIKADMISRRYINETDCTQPTSPLLPASRCMLTLNGHTIHGHYASEIRLGYSTPILFQYLQSRHQ